MSKFLGIDIDDRLFFSTHVTNVVKKISRCNGTIFRASKYVGFSVLKSLYYSLVYPYISYCVSVWGASSIGNVKKVCASQNRILKFLCKFNPNMTIMNFHNVHRFSVAIAIYRYFISIKSPYFYNKFAKLVPMHSHNTRNVEYKLLNLPECRKTVCQRNFFFQSVGIWNDLPHEIRQSTSLTKFKRSSKNYFFHS